MPRKKVNRLVIDTNIWISILINNDFSFIDKLIDNNDVTLIFSEELLDEFLEVVYRPKFNKYFSKNEINHILEYIGYNAEFINVASDVNICRDGKDNFLLSLARDGKADYIISGDKDLLDLIRFESTEIIKIKDFSERIK